MLKKVVKKYYKLYYLILVLKLLFHKINIIFLYRFKKEVKNRAKIEIFSFKELSSDLRLYSNFFYKENSLYGNDKAVDNALKGKLKHSDYIEHGYYFGNHVQIGTYNIDSNIITYSYQRVKHLENKFKESNANKENRKVVTIGPYINYSVGLMKIKNKEEIKEKYGKILLVFPSHSIEGVSYKYNTEDFIKEIEKISLDFDNVFVCMYWKDIQDQRYLEYEKKDFKVVTAGHRNDPNFLGRLKDIIDLSDMTISNTVGTHIGYCVARNKPHYLFNQFQKLEGERVEEEFKERKNQNYVKIRDEEIEEVIDAFSNLSYIITEKQRLVVEKYWGKNEVKYHIITKEENNNV
ncbi:hypothetical protein ACFOZY_05980 [Chungangia koreensis]|uniref:Polysaccharide pyruvyl transferase domain-containing protein n=1 Tax=Chungangia koreensis TaxID=752657 RepID=A0ABV8X6U1_9LACT